MKTKIKKCVTLSWKYVILSLILMMFCGHTAEAKTTKWTSWDGQWYANGDVYYISGNALYKSPLQPHSQGIKKKIASWKLKEDVYLKITHAYKNNIYVCYSAMREKSIVYSVNIKTKKKTKLWDKCDAVTGSGKYIYGNKIKVTDTGAYPVYIWKIQNNSLKKVKTLGKYIFGTTAVKHKIYYASYPSYPKNGQKKMVVYRCNADGSHRKKLFTLTGKGKYCQVLISDVNEKTITAAISGDNSGQYTYTIKTGKLKKK